MNFFRKISITLDDRSARLAGIALMLAGVCMFSLGDALGKFIVATYSVGQFMLLRACAALALIGPPIWCARAEFTRVERPWLQVVRIVLSTLEIAAFFLAVVYLPLADVTTYYLATPIFVTALSAVVLREQVGWRRWSAILIGFCGVLIALAGSLAFSWLMLITRSLRATPDIVLASAQFLGTLVFGIVVAPFGWITPTWAHLGLFFAAGAISVCALLCVNRSLKLAPASTVAPY